MLSGRCSFNASSPECLGTELRIFSTHFRVVKGNGFLADFDPMLQAPPLVIDSEDNHEGRGFSETLTLFLSR